MSNRIVIVGFGGHAKACLDVAISLGLEVPFMVGTPGCPDEVNGITILSEEEAIVRIEYLDIDKVFVAVGDNSLRKNLATLWDRRGFKLSTLISPLANVSPSATIGSGTIVMPNAFVGPSVLVDRGVILNTASVIEHDSRVGQFSHIGPNACLTGSVAISEDVLIGAGSVIIPKLTVTSGVTIGAGAVVISNIEEPGTYVGSPVRRIL